VPPGTIDTADRLRSDIDHGRSGDKVDFPDAAAAPLGTDDEAGGTPPSPRRVAVARAGAIKQLEQPARRARGYQFASLLLLLVAGLLAGCGLWMFLL
jgi:hypothetical protein